MSWAFAYRSASEAAGLDPRPELEEEDLQSIVLNGNCSERFERRVTDTEAALLARAVSAASGIVELDLSYNNITDEGALAIADMLRRNATVQQLNLAYNQVTASGARALADALMLNTSVLAVSLRGNDIGEDGGSAFGTMLRGNRTLATLDLGNCGLATKSLMSILLALTAHPSLSILKLDRPRFSGPQELLTVVQHLTHMLSRNNMLSEVALDRFGLTDEHLATLLPALVQNTSIEVLTLSGNKLGSDSGELLAKLLARRPDIVGLDLAGNRIGDGIVELAAGIRGHPGLSALALGSNAVGHRGLAALAQAAAGCRTLQQLLVWGNRFDPEASKAFHAYRAKLEALGYIDVEFYEVDGEPMIAQRND